MSRKVNLTRSKRPFIQRLLVPRRDLGMGHFLRGYYARIPIYILLFATMGIVATLAVSLSTGGPIDPSALDITADLTSTHHYTVKNLQQMITEDREGGYVGGTITIYMKNFWLITGYDSAKAEINIYWPQLEEEYPHTIAGLPVPLTPKPPERGGFPLEQSGYWGSDGSGELAHIGNRAYPDASGSRPRTVKDIFRLSSRQPDYITIEFDLWDMSRAWAVEPKDIDKIYDKTWPIFQFCVQIVHDNKAILASSKSYNVYITDSDIIEGGFFGRDIYEGVDIEEADWEQINGEIVPDLVWPTGGPLGFWDFIWDFRGSMPNKDVSGKLPIPVLGDILKAVTDVFGINIFDTEWAGPIAAGGALGIVFWLTGAEFIIVDLFGLIPYVVGTNYNRTMDMGETFGFWIFKVGFDFLPLLVFGGIIVALLAMGGFAVLGPLVTSAAGEVVREIPKFLVKVPRRAIMFLFFFLTFILSLFLLMAKFSIGFILLIFSIIGFIITLLRFLAVRVPKETLTVIYRYIIPAIVAIIGVILLVFFELPVGIILAIAGIIPPLAGFLYFVFVDVPRRGLGITRNVLRIILVVVSFVTGIILLLFKVPLGILFLIFAALVGLIEVVTSPFVGIGRAIMGAEAPIARARQHKKTQSRSRRSSYDRMKTKIRTKR